MLTAGPSSEPVLAANAGTRLSHDQYEKVHRLHRAANAVDNYGDLFRLLADFCGEIEAGAVNCAIFDNQRLELVGVSSTMSEAAVDRYFQQNLAMDDPLIPRIRFNPKPALLGWGMGLTPLWRAGNGARIFDAMQDDGYHGLVYFPVPVSGGPFSATITIRNPLEPERGQAFLESEYSMLHYAAEIVGHRAVALFRGTATGENWHSFGAPALSNREREVIARLVEGERTEQIAFNLNIRPVTVQMHINSARRKTGAKTREQLIAHYVLQGL